MAQTLQTANRATVLGLSGYHWLVIAAGWAGWGFDVFDALLFNFVAPNCVPVLLHIPLGSPEARQATVFWTGAITSIRLVGWAAARLPGPGRLATWPPKTWSICSTDWASTTA